jgi:hypothetical protein
MGMLVKALIVTLKKETACRIETLVFTAARHLTVSQQMMR